MSTGLKRKRQPTYSEEALTKAIKDVKSGASINDTGRKYNIPRSTLHSRVTNKHSSRLGTKPVLSDKDEADLAKWIEQMCAIDCSVSRNQIGDSVVLSLKTSNKPNPFVNKIPGKNWFDAFLRRHHLTEKVRENRRQTLKGIGVDGMNKWFARLNDCLKEKELHTLSRTRMYSIGEVSLPLHLKTNPWCLKEGPTVIIAGNAAGHLLPPMIIFDSKDISNKCDGILPRGWSVEASEDADLSSELLYNYVKNHFYSWLVKNLVQLPIVLFLYQQLATYMTQVLYDFCHEHKIILSILPSSPHHATTPIEISFFPILKKEYTKKLGIFVRKKRIVTISKNDFVARLEEALNWNVEDNLENGFYKCGLYPLSAERYIKACIKLESDENIKSVVQNRKQRKKASVVNQSSVLKCIESGLDPETIKSFRLAIDDLTWTGKVEDTNLFYFWRKITKSDIFEEEQQSDVGLESNESNDEHSLLDFENENQERKGPFNYTSGTKSCMPEGKRKPSNFIDDNLNSEGLDRNVSIIVVHPNTCVDEGDSDYA